MKFFKSLLLFLSLFVYLNASAQDYHVRIAFIGNSITIGAGLTNPTVECYPSRVDQMLQKVYGDTCIVKNFANSGRTMLKKGDYPIWNEIQFPEMWKFAPDIVYILMGTNDSKPYNWEPYKDEFFSDYMSMIDTMKVRNPRTRFIISYPPPAYKVVWDIRDSVILNCVIPIVDSIKAITGAELVDFYHPLVDSISLFPDFIHPGVQGSIVMGRMVYDKIIETDIIHKVETGYTYVTNVKSDKKVIPPGNPAIISWTSINADSVIINGKKFEVNGSMTVNPLTTTSYTIYAYGKKSIDSMTYTQTVYIPELDKVVPNPKIKTIDQNDSLLITLKFYDQKNNVMLDNFDVQWTITQGGGYFIEKTNESAIFVASEAGKSYLAASVGSISAEIRVTVEAKVGVKDNTLKKSVNVYPNPVNDKLNFELFSDQSSKIEANIYDLKGVVCLKQQFQLSSNTLNKFIMNLESLKPGTYLFEISGSEKLYSGKIIKTNN